jgi:hypothetical protein
MHEPLESISFNLFLLLFYRNPKLQRRFVKMFSIFLLFSYYISFYLNNLESPKDDVCQVWLKLAQWFWRRSRKCKSRRTNTLTHRRKIDNYFFLKKWKYTVDFYSGFHCSFPSENFWYKMSEKVESEITERDVPHIACMGNVSNKNTSTSY